MSVCLDRFSQGLPDPADADVRTFCSGCGGEIYESNEVYVTNTGDILHADMDCVREYLGLRIMTVEEALEVS
jgi:hypothetical protein